MYSSIVSIQILISLLKQHDIDTIVISAGQSNSSFARSVEHDSFFNCYSVVDERSAAFFAIGLALEKKKPIAISCTASTACCNYISAITEAFYREIPIVVLTSNYDIRRVDQMKLLAIHQENMFREITKKEVQLPDVSDKRSFDYCQRLINEALLELDHHGKGPVHIDVPSYDNPLEEKCSVLPKTRAIKRIQLTDDYQSYSDKLSSKKIMLLCGQDYYDENTINEIKLFQDHYGCVVCGEHMSNIGLKKYVNITPIVSSYSKDMFKEYKPDVLISLGKHVQFDWYFFEKMGIEHWLVSESGDVCDSFNELTTIFEADKYSFIKKMNELKQSTLANEDYINQFLELKQGIKIPDLPLSHFWVIQQFCKVIPDYSILHLSIFNSIRLTQYFDLPSHVRSYANYGGLGIDGSMSTFLGQATIFEGLSFLIIGDLSFFYDMNSLMIRHNRNNIRILLLNNSGGAEFYQNNGWYDTIDLHTAAKHSHSAKSWAEENKFVYLCAHSKNDFNEVIDSFVSSGDKPIILEVFTNMLEDEKALKTVREENSHISSKDQLKNIVKSAVGKKGINTIKKIMKMN